MNLLSLGRALRRGWIWVLLILLAALAGGWVVTSSMAAQYESSSRVLYALNSQGSLQTQIQATSLAIQRAATDAQLVPTPTILVPAIEALGDPDITLETVGEGVTALATETLLDIVVVLDDPDDAAALNNSIIEVLRTRATAAQIIVDPLDPASLVYTFELTTIVPPTVPETPTSPSLLINLLIAFAVGVLGAAIYLATRMSRDKRIYDLETLRATTDLPVVGTLAIRGGNRTGAPRAQDLGTLRAALQSRAPEGGTWLLTSAGDVRTEGVGRSLASSMSAIGRRTTLLATENGSAGPAGLTDYLTGAADADAVVDTTTIPGVSYVGHGTLAEDGADILAGADTPKGLATLTKGSDVIFVTAAPADKSADAAALARLGMQTLVLVRRGRTTTPQLSRAISALTEAGGEIAGLVWTKSAQ